MLKRLWKKLKDAKINKNILKDEAKFLKDTDRYNFFGYFMDEERELPVFITEGEVKDNCRTGEFVYVYTSKMLEHCVKHLTEDAKLKEAQDVESFKKKCTKLSERAIYQNESWEYKIKSLITYLQDFKKSKAHEKQVLAKKQKYKEFNCLYDSDIPAFYTYKVVNGNLDLKCCENWIATPKILKHCVEHMSDDLKQFFAMHSDRFIERCEVIMLSDIDDLFLEQDWEDMINSLVEYLKEYTKTNENNV